MYNRGAKVVLKPKHYFIIQIEKKKFLVKFLSKEGEAIKGLCVQNTSKEVVMFKKEDILATLGKNPVYGNAYGLKVEPHIKTESLDFAAVHYYRKVTKADKAVLYENLTKAYDTLSDLDVGNFPIVIEVKHNPGKIEGTYKYNEDMDIITLKPAEFNVDILPLIYHELGHQVWNRDLDAKTKASWVDFYHKGVALSTASKSSVKNVCTLFDDHKMKVGEFHNYLEEEYGEDAKEILIFSEIMSYIQDKHHLNTKYFDLLILAGVKIRKYFPKCKLKLTNYNILVSEYAEKNPEELFCETFSYFLSKRKLTDEATALITKTLLKS